MLIFTKVLLLRLQSAIVQESCHPIGIRPPYNLKYIEALLLKHKICGVQLIDQRITDLSFDGVLRAALEYSPEVIVISITTLDLEVSLKFCRKIRENYVFGMTAIIGIGQEITANIEKYKSCRDLDFLLRGEAEFEAVSIIEKIKNGSSLESLRSFYRDTGRENTIFQVEVLDDLPLPVYNLRALKKYCLLYPLKLIQGVVWGQILSSRGCVHECIFCSQIMRESYGRKIRCRSAGNVADEMEYLVNLGVNVISFSDDNFTGSYRHVEAVCNEIRRRKLKARWIIHSRVDEVTLPLLRLLRDSGCVLVRFGIETGSERVLDILKKTNDPSRWLRQSKKAVEMVKSLGMSVACFFIIGCPKETKDDFLRTVQFAQELSPNIIQAAYFTPFPGSKAYDMFKNSIKRIDFSRMYHYGAPIVNLSSMQDMELSVALSYFYRQFLMRRQFIVRHFLQYVLFYLANPRLFFRFSNVVRRLLINKK